MNLNWLNDADNMRTSNKIMGKSDSVIQSFNHCNEFFWWMMILNSNLIMILQEAANNLPAEEADYIKLYCQMPPISKMDASLNTLKNCEYVECNLLYSESKFFKWIQCFFAVQRLPRSHFFEQSHSYLPLFFVSWSSHPKS